MVSRLTDRPSTKLLIDARLEALRTGSTWHWRRRLPRKN